MDKLHAAQQTALREMSLQVLGAIREACREQGENPSLSLNHREFWSEAAEVCQNAAERLNKRWKLHEPGHIP